MEFFAIGLEPPGNIVRDIRRGFQEAHWGPFPSLGLGMPTAAYLGFYRRTPPGSGISRKTLAKDFKVQAVKILPEIPETLRFCSSTKRLSLILETPGSLGKAIQAADSAAGSLGLEAQGGDFFMPLGEFFFPNAVTSPRQVGFSFRRVDIILLRCISDAEMRIALSWETLCKIRRPLGPRKGRSPIET
ncbi:MAG: hypothetical protein FD137_2416 [Spirochaetes bacterium]|nr:MAG: hypothetical protein FD137_2416 [Spirochaetota bacterium]